MTASTVAKHDTCWIFQHSLVIDKNGKSWSKQRCFPAHDTWQTKVFRYIDKAITVTWIKETTPAFLFSVSLVGNDTLVKSTWFFYFEFIGFRQTLSNMLYRDKDCLKCE